MAKSSKLVDMQFASIVELARCVECLEKIAENLEKAYGPWDGPCTAWVSCAR